MEKKETPISIVSEKQIIQGTYIQFGDAHKISGMIKGNAYVFGTEVVVDGIIEGDFIAIASSVTFTGLVTGNVYILAGEGLIGGKILGDLFLSGIALETKGSVCKNLCAIGGGVKMSGLVGQNARAFAAQIELLSGTQILGDLHYRSYHPAAISQEAMIKGQITYSASFLRDLQELPIVQKIITGSRVAGFLMNFFYTSLVGFVFLQFFPKKLQKTLSVLKRRPWRSLFFGFFIFLLVPLVAMGLLISIIGTPVALTLLVLNVISFYTVKIFPILAFANCFCEKVHVKKNSFLSLLMGQVVYSGLTLIPLFGWTLSFCVMLLGLGASIKAQLLLSD